MERRRARRPVRPAARLTPQPPRSPEAPRPVVLNTWEAVYYRQGLAPLVALAETAADIGVERFVLDDGWFLGRRSDSTSLGDWRVDPTVWPDGLGPLVDRVRGLGMEFGLWFEPEMVSPVSELAAAHPEWLLQRPEDDVRTWRNQYVLDMANPLARAYVLEAMSAVIGAHHVDFVKWDQNRDIVHAVHAGRAGIDAHTRGVWTLMDALRARHPWLEIEACASGGARVDLGVLERTDRVWPSDSNDAFERLPIQRWTEALLPLELIGSHVGPEVSHTTGRHLDLDFRMAVSLFGSAGIETDVTRLSPTELDRLRAWTALYKRERGLLHTGRLRHLELGDPGLVATSVVAVDRSRALVRVARTETGPQSLPVPLRMRGSTGRGATGSPPSRGCGCRTDSTWCRRRGSCAGTWSCRALCSRTSGRGCRCWLPRPPSCSSCTPSTDATLPAAVGLPAADGRLASAVGRGRAGAAGERAEHPGSWRAHAGVSPARRDGAAVLVC
ncbi:alpha-galactosidase [Sphingomonas sp. LR61]|uniref:alpha-galactosidase n=1 Tax=Sphingomonas sp. LR61 TaxID=3050234 RepID=UPI002FDFBBD6